MRISDWSSDVCSSDLYTDDYIDNQLPETPQRIPSWTTVDLGLAYAFSGETPWLRGLSLQFNALNAFDRDPPRIFDTLASYGNPGYDTENASPIRSEEHTSELQSLMRISYAVFCLKKKKPTYS